MKMSMVNSLGLGGQFGLQSNGKGFDFKDKQPNPLTKPASLP
jgi:hypothetical protein